MAKELKPMQGLAEFLRSRAEIDGSDGCFAEADTLLRWAAEVEAALSAPLALPPEPGQPNTSLVDSSSRSGSTLCAGALSLPCVAPIADVCAQVGCAVNARMTASLPCEQGDDLACTSCNGTGAGGIPRGPGYSFSCPACKGSGVEQRNRT